MMKYIFILLLFASANVHAQSGQLIERAAFSISSPTVRQLNATVPDAGKLLGTVKLYRITYLSDGLRVKGYLLAPKKPGKYPCIIYNRGGSGNLGMMTDTGVIQRGLAEIAAAGYVVVGSQYRGNDGGEGKEEFGGADIADVLNLIPLLASLPEADTSRMGMFGWSRGGLMTYRTLTLTARMKAAVVGSGVADLLSHMRSRPEFDSIVFPRFIPDYSSNKEAAVLHRSPLRFADSISRNTPILMMHGTADWRVPANQVLGLVNKFYELKQPFRFILYEGGQHSLVEHRADYLRQTIGWFNTYVRDGARWPSLDKHGD